MGHANLDTTLKLYTRVLGGSLRNAVKAVSGELVVAGMTEAALDSEV